MKLEVKNLRKSFGENEILHGISFSVENGKALGLLGRNGAGKTTTFYIITCNCCTLLLKKHNNSLFYINLFQRKKMFFTVKIFLLIINRIINQF